MKQLVVLVCVLVVVAALPVPEEPKTSLDLLQIPLQNGKELDILSLTDENGKLSERNKRTIDILRQLFPTISQIIEQKIQMILPVLIRTVGPLLLRGGLGGSSGGGTAQTGNGDDDDVETNAGDRKVSVSLPVFEPGSDDDDEDDDFVDNSAKPTSASSTIEPEKTISLRTRIDGVEAGGDEDPTAEPVAETAAATVTTKSDNQNLAAGKDADNSLDANAINEQLETIRVVREAVAAAAAKDRLETTQQEEQGVRNLEATGDQSPAESQAPAVDDLSLDNEADDENRNKRFLPFGFSSSSGGSGGTAGSGNFLFDIIRLFAGSSGTQSQDESANAADGAAVGGDGYTEGIPGPVTRLFVLGNRGLSNLIQDLILRIARTSERLVNFKARLITSLI